MQERPAGKYWPGLPQFDRQHAMLPASIAGEQAGDIDTSHQS
jgi:hypothetical protein